jgi:hypothetical protein
VASKGKEIFPSLQPYPTVASSPAPHATLLGREEAVGRTTTDPAELYPHLHVLLRHRGLPFRQAFSREETLLILGICDKTLGRWLEKGRLEAYDLPDVFASAADLERCLANGRRRSAKVTIPNNLSISGSESPNGESM